jgi:hypothetical protein
VEPVPPADRLGNKQRGIPMRKLISITALTAVAVTAFAVPSVASAADQARFSGSLVIALPVGPARGSNPAVTIATTAWNARITTKNSACAYKRLVTIWEVRSGADRKLGSTRGKREIVNGKAYYHIFFKKIGYLAKTGRTYAKMNPTSECQGVQSGNFSVRTPGGPR